MDSASTLEKSDHLDSEDDEGTTDVQSSPKTHADTAPNGQRNWMQSSTQGTAEEESDLRQFLKVVRPEWSCPKKHGLNDMNRALEKLKSIGVSDTRELMRRVNRNTINEDFLMAGKSRFSQETMEALRKKSPFIRALDHLKEPYVRQIGAFAPVPQLLSGTNLRLKEKRKSPQPVYDDASADARPSSEPGRRRQPQKHATSSGSRRAGKSDFSLQSSVQSVPSETLASLNGSVGLGDLGGTMDLKSVDGRLASLQASVCGCSSANRSLVVEDVEDEPWAVHRPRALYLRGGRPRHRQTDMTQTPGHVYSLTDLTRLQEGDTSDGRGRHGTHTPLSNSQSSMTFSPSGHGHRDRLGDPDSPDSSPRSSVAFSKLPSRSRRASNATLGSNASGSPRSSVAFSRVSSRPRRASNVTVESGVSVHSGKFRGVGFKQAPSQLEGEAAEDEADELLEAHVETYNKEGSAMSEGHRDARWAHRAHDPEAAIHQCEAMLQEQDALDERRRLEQFMTNEGPQSPLRHHIVMNIRKLLKAEKDRDVQGALDAHQRTVNIRKHLVHMQAKRRDLAMVRVRAKEAIFGKSDKPTSTSTFLAQ